MADCRLVTAGDYLVASTSASSTSSTYLDPEDDPDDELPDTGELVDMAIEADGIAHIPGTLVVFSPHRANVEMPLRVQVWDRPPNDDTAEWPEAFEAHLEVDRHGRSYDSPTMGTVSLGAPPAGYHTLITGHGFVAHGWPGSTTQAAAGGSACGRPPVRVRLDASVRGTLRVKTRHGPSWPGKLQGSASGSSARPATE